jgi:hypothetical protein
MNESVMAAPQYASSRRAGVRHDHIVVPDPQYASLLRAACSRRIWLDSCAQHPAADTAVPLRCQRKGCRSRWPTPLPPRGGETFSVADLVSFSTQWDMVAWAEHVLADYDLEDWDWLVHSLASSMEEAAWDAYDMWILDHEAELRQTCHLPRWCPCGKWPDFGTDCWYHGPCKCVSRSKDRGTGLVYWTSGWLSGFRDSNGEFPVPVLDQGCPVHPDGPMPREVFRAWEVNDKRHQKLKLLPVRTAA